MWIEWQVYEYVNMRSTCKIKWADNNLSINPFKYQDTFKIGPNLRPCLLMSNINLLQISCLDQVKYFNITIPVIV